MVFGNLRETIGNIWRSPVIVENLRNFSGHPRKSSVFSKIFETLLVNYKEIAGSDLVNFGIFGGPWVICAVSASQAEQAPDAIQHDEKRSQKKFQ